MYRRTGMSGSERKILLSSGVLPVILGGNPVSAFVFSLRLLIKYGVCTVFCGRGSLAVSLLNPKCGAMSAANKNNPRLFTERMIRFAENNDEFTLLIVPMSKKSRELVFGAKEELESRYIILDSRRSLFLHPLFNERY